MTSGEPNAVPGSPSGTEFDPAADARRAVAIAGHRGDLDIAHRGLEHPDPTVRSTALGALERLGALTADRLHVSLADRDPTVRRRAAELAANHPDTDLGAALHDDDHGVLEVAAWAAGEHESSRDPIVHRLIELAAHDEALVRESAVAALGAIGDERAVPTIVNAATNDKPAVRRRAVLALAPFVGPEVDAAIATALDDRDWQVRQSAEDLSPTGPGEAD